MPSEPIRSDLVSDRRAYFLLWRLPWIAVIASLVLKDSSLKAGIWATAFTQMGVACIANASGCGRMHCFFTGPVYLLAAVASFFRGSGRLSIPWPVLGALTCFGICALWWLPERLWGTYAGRSARVTEAFDRFTNRARRAVERVREEADGLSRLTWAWRRILLSGTLAYVGVGAVGGDGKRVILVKPSSLMKDHVAG